MIVLAIVIGLLAVVIALGLVGLAIAEEFSAEQRRAQRIAAELARAQLLLRSLHHQAERDLHDAAKIIDVDGSEQ